VNHEYKGEERRSNPRPLTRDEIADIKNQILESIYADFGKSIIKKILWVSGACVLALFSWLTMKGHIRID
jgi:hypothetical protein